MIFNLIFLLVVSVAFVTLMTALGTLIGLDATSALGISTLGYLGLMVALMAVGGVVQLVACVRASRHKPEPTRF